MADIVNSVLRGLVGIVNALVSWMPDSPFRGFIESVGSSVGSEFLGYLNYFLPIREFLGILTLWVSAILLYYAVSVVLRWARAIS